MKLTYRHENHHHWSSVGVFVEPTHLGCLQVLHDPTWSEKLFISSLTRKPQQELPLPGVKQGFYTLLEERSPAATRTSFHGIWSSNIWPRAGWLSLHQPITAVCRFEEIRVGFTSLRHESGLLRWSHEIVSYFQTMPALFEWFSPGCSTPLYDPSVTSTFPTRSPQSNPCLVF